MSTKKLQIIGNFGAKIYTQNDEPTDATEGALWVDLDDEGAASSQIQPDWNQNDPTASDYIKNRTHYEEVTERKVTITIKPGDVVGASVANQIYEQRETAKYEIDGADYSYQYWYDASDGTGDYFLYDGQLGIRVTRRFDNTIQFYRTTNPQDVYTALDGERLTAGVTFYGEVAEVHKLDSKYLPDGLGIINLYVCSDGEYVADGSPTIAEPDEDTTYLVPQDNEGILYASWVYVNGAWEFVEMLTVTLDETSGGNGSGGLSAYEIAVKNGFEGTEQEWLESLQGEPGIGISSIKQTATSSTSGGNNIITITCSNGTTSTFTVKNGSKGSTPVKGTDYFTDADKQEMINAVIAALPVYNGEAEVV